MKKVLFNLILLMSTFIIESKNNKEFNYDQQRQKTEYELIRLSESSTQNNKGEMVDHFYKEEPMSSTEEEFNEMTAKRKEAEEYFHLSPVLSMTSINNHPIYSINNKVVTAKEYNKAKQKEKEARAIFFNQPTAIQNGSLYYKYGPKIEITKEEYNEIFNQKRRIDLTSEKNSLDALLSKTDTDLAAYYRNQLTKEINKIEKRLEEIK